MGHSLHLLFISSLSAGDHARGKDANAAMAGGTDKLFPNPWPDMD